jgi:mRNA-degrading endonuclease RelE of RelBE toxin-antitoxin system
VRALTAALEELAVVAAATGRIRAKKLKTIRGRPDSFHRLRVGDYHVMYDLIEEDRVLLVLGIVHRSDLIFSDSRAATSGNPW